MHVGYMLVVKNLGTIASALYHSLVAVCKFEDIRRASVD